MRIERVLAPNPGVYTLEGTNTWIVGDAPAVVIDPGPADEGHLERVAERAGQVVAILLTHGHEDHAPGAATRWHDYGSNGPLTQNRSARTRFSIASQEARMESGIRKVVRMTNSIEMPSTPIW